MTVTVPTSEAQYGYVVGRVIRALGDTTDPDDKPDAVAATGKVTAWVGKKKVGKATLNKKGKAKIVVKGKKLSTGKNKVKITFDGDDYNGAAKGKVKIKVVG